LVLVGVPDPVPALRLLRAKEGHSLSARVIAVLPRELEAEELNRILHLADEFILWPDRAEAVQFRVARFLASGLEVDRTYEKLLFVLAKVNLVGRDPAFLRMADKIELSSGNDFPTLITGETGTGKELFAHAIHFLSPRRNQPFIPVDCGGIPDHLFENELFGHARGAYTDAHLEQRGMAALADKGTLFLDEVDSLSPTSQAKLLRFLQDHHFKPLGSERYVRSDVKIVAATNRNLKQLVAEKQFRQDLYFRLHVLHLELPPLRERPQDIPMLAEHFLSIHTPAGERKFLTPAALHKLMSYDWPGNVRELANVIQRAIVFCRGTQISGCDIGISEPICQERSLCFRKAREQAVQGFEREYVNNLLLRNGGNITWAAKEAGQERRAFGRLVKKYNAAPR
jgi:DNA-binding NtrC family response regulator